MLHGAQRPRVQEDGAGIESQVRDQQHSGRLFCQELKIFLICHPHSFEKCRQLGYKWMKLRFCIGDFAGFDHV